MKIAQFLFLSVMLSALGCQAGTSSPFFQGDRVTAVEVGSKGAWTVKGGVLGCDGNHEGYAWLSTDRTFGNFELTLDWRIGPGGNTGVFCMAPDREGRTSMKGFEIQIRDDASDKNLQDVSGAVFNRIPAAGMFRLEWEGDKPKIHAQAESFPVLVQELSKGLVEINMAHGLPKEGEMSKKEAEEIIRRADKPAHEYLHFIMGPALAGRLTRALTSHKGWMDSGTGHKGHDMAYTRSLLSMVPEDKLHSNLHDVLSGGGKEKLAVENLKRHMKTVEDNYGG